MTVGGGAGGFGGQGAHGFAGGHIGGVGRLNGYGDDWMAKTKKTIEDELRFRGIAPETISEIVSKIEEPSLVMPVLLAIVTTAFVCTLIFVAIWESTP
jgi:hypothetical protein